MWLHRRFSLNFGHIVDFFGIIALFSICIKLFKFPKENFTDYTCNTSSISFEEKTNYASFFKLMDVFDLF